MTPLTVIESLRASDEYIEVIFTEGSCYKFHLFLKTIFPGSNPHIHIEKENHIATEIEGVLYDISGIVNPKDFRPLKEKDLEMVERWSFYKNNLLKFSECESCGEEFIYKIEK